MHRPGWEPAGRDKQGGTGLRDMSFSVSCLLTSYGALEMSPTILEPEHSDCHWENIFLL